MAPWDNDYSGQLSSLMAPYQQMAQRFQTPYATMPANNPIANFSPRLAMGLDNAALVASQVHGGMTIGENIQGVAGALVGANQFRRQQQMMQAMLPYQMAGPALDFADKFSQMKERQAQSQALQSRIPLEQAQTKYYNSRSDYYDSRQQLDNPTALSEKLGMAMFGISDINKMTPDQATKFGQYMTEQHARTSGARGGFQPGGMPKDTMDLVIGAYGPPSDPSKGYTQEDYAAMGKSYGAYQSGVAGQRAAQEQKNTQPQKDANTLLANERQGRYDDIPKPVNMSWKDFETSAMDKAVNNAATPGAEFKLPTQEDYQTYRNKNESVYTTAKTQRDKEFALYESMGGAKAGQSFHTWRGQNQQAISQLNAPTPSPMTDRPSNPYVDNVPSNPYKK